MKITFNQWLDGFTPNLAIGEATVGERWVGPLGLLSQLEARLGLVGTAQSDPERIDAFSRRIEATVEPSAFYARSWEKDPWGVARKLLDFRDELVTAGWSGLPIPEGGPRLRALAAIEGQTNLPLPPGIADRMRRMKMALAGCKKNPGLDQVCVAGSAIALPSGWAKIFERLAALGVTITQAQLPGAPPAKPGTDLHRLQGALLGAAHRPAKKRATGDGSVVLLEGRTPWEAAEALAAWLASTDPGEWPTSTTIVRGCLPELLDRALERHGLPTIGSTVASTNRPALQILPLLVSLFWLPKSPQAMMELLALPVSPISKRLSRFLLDALAEAPGVGGTFWQKAADEAVRGAKDPERLQAQLRDWLLLPVFSEQTGIPIPALRDVCHRLAAWARKRAEHETEVTRHALNTAAAQAQQMGALLDSTPRETLDRQYVERLLESVTRSGTERILHAELSGRLYAVDHPGAMVAPNTWVAWWGFSRSAAARSQPTPWRPAEVQACARAGITLDDPIQHAARTAASWRVPLWQANERVLFVSFDAQAGEPEAPHPLWDEVAAHLQLDDASTPKIRKRVASLLADPTTQKRRAKPSGLKCRMISPKPAPRPRAAWQLDPTLLGPRQKESATSIEKLLSCPFGWVLQYSAGLYHQGLPFLADDTLLFGRLAHWLLADFLVTHRAKLPPPQAARQAMLKRFDQAVAQEAATLLMKGRREEHDTVRQQIGVATETLLTAIAKGRFEIVGTELPLEGGSFSDRPLTGTADLVLSNAAYPRVVVDLKWSGRSFRQALLREGQAVQLAVYAQALKPKQTERLPPGAYFILEEATFLTTEHGLFDGALVVAGPTLDETWRAVLDSHRAARSHFDAGEVVAPPLLKKESPQMTRRAEQPLDLKASCRFCDFRAFCSGEEEVAP